MKIGDRIKRRREKLKMSQRDLAAKIGYTDHTTITRIESGKTDPPQKKVAAIAKALGTTPGYLMGWTDNPIDEGTLAAKILKDPEAFQHMKDFMTLSPADRYALRVVMDTLKAKKIEKMTDAKASVVKVDPK